MEFTPLFTLLLLSLLTITSLVLNTGLPEIRFTPKHNIWKQNALWPTAKKYYRCGDDDHDTSIGMSRMLANVKRRHGLRGAQSRLNLEESSPGCLPELLVDQRHLVPPGACQLENLTINGGAWGENREKRSVNIPPCLASILEIKIFSGTSLDQQLVINLHP